MNLMVGKGLVPAKASTEENMYVCHWIIIWFNPWTSVSHWSGFKVKFTFHGIQFFGSSLYTGQI